MTETMWDDSADALSVEAQQRGEQYAIASVREFEPFLAAAMSQAEFDNRLSMVAESVEKTVFAATGEARYFATAQNHLRSTWKSTLEDKQRTAAADRLRRSLASGWLDAARRIVENHQHEEVDGMLLDAFSASAMVQIYDALSGPNQERYAAMSLAQAHNMAMKMLNKTSATFEPKEKDDLGFGEPFQAPTPEEMADEETKKIVSEPKTAASGPLPAHLQEFWGNLTVDPRDKPHFCLAQSKKTPSIPWHNGSVKCLSCGKSASEYGLGVKTRQASEYVPDTGQRCPSCGQYEAHSMPTGRVDEDGEEEYASYCYNCDYGVGNFESSLKPKNASFFRKKKEVDPDKAMGGGSAQEWQLAEERARKAREQREKDKANAGKATATHKTADAIQQAVQKGMMMGMPEFTHPDAMLPGFAYVVMEPGPNGSRPTDRKTTDRDEANRWAVELLARTDWSPWTKTSAVDSVQEGDVVTYQQWDWGMGAPGPIYRARVTWTDGNVIGVSQMEPPYSIDRTSLSAIQSVEKTGSLDGITAENQLVFGRPPGPRAEQSASTVPENLRPSVCGDCGKWRNAENCPHCDTEATLAVEVRNPTVLDWVMHGLAPSGAFGSRRTADISWQQDTHLGVGFLSGTAPNGDIYEVYSNPNNNPTPCAWARYGPEGDTGLGSQIERQGGFATMQEAMQAASANAMQKSGSRKTAAYCEDYPACGHTDQDPCDRQWYDEPGAFDVTRPGNQHALCDHEYGDCQVYASKQASATCQYDSGSMYGNQPMCDRPAEYVVTYSNGSTGPMELFVCSQHRGSAEGGAFPGVSDVSKISALDLISSDDVLEAIAALDIAEGNLSKAAAVFPVRHNAPVTPNISDLRSETEEGVSKKKKTRDKQVDFFDKNPTERGMKQQGSRSQAATFQTGDNVGGGADPNEFDVSRTPYTTRPRVKPSAPSQTEFVVPEDDKYDSLEDFGKPNFEQQVAAKIGKVARQVIEDNPHLSMVEARQIALTALSSHPGVMSSKKKASAIEWEESEFDQDISAAWLNGIEGFVTPPSSDSPGWYWYVKPTSSRSEWPEVDSGGSVSTEAEAKAACEEAMKSADATYPKVNYG